MKSSSIVDTAFDALNYTLMAVVSAVMILPFLYVTSYSLSDPNLLRGGFIVFPQGFSLQAYAHVLGNPDVFHGVIVSVARTVVGPVFMIIFTGMAAYVITRDDYLGVKFFRKFFIFTLYFNGGLIPLYLVVKSFGLTGSFWVYILPATVAVFNMVLIKTYIESVPKALEESALIDGASDIVLFWKVLFPVCLPVISAVALFSAVYQWNSFVDTQIYNAMVRELFPLQYILYQAVSSASIIPDSLTAGQMAQLTPQSLKMAITFITVLPIMMLYPFLQRYFVKGLLIGSIKG